MDKYIMRVTFKRAFTLNTNNCFLDAFPMFRNWNWQTKTIRYSDEKRHNPLYLLGIPVDENALDHLISDLAIWEADKLSVHYRFTK